MRRFGKVFAMLVVITFAIVTSYAQVHSDKYLKIISASYEKWAPGAHLPAQKKSGGKIFTVRILITSPDSIEIKSIVISNVVLPWEIWHHGNRKNETKVMGTDTLVLIARQNVGESYARGPRLPKKIKTNTSEGYLLYCVDNKSYFIWIPLMKETKNNVRNP